MMLQKCIHNSRRSELDSNTICARGLQTNVKVTLSSRRHGAGNTKVGLCLGGSSLSRRRHNVCVVHTKYPQESFGAFLYNKQDESSVKVPFFPIHQENLISLEL